MRLRVHYQRPADLVADHDQQFVRGGLFVRVVPAQPLMQHDALELEVVTPGNQRILIPARVLQVMGTVGVAVGFDVPAELTTAVTRARTAALPNAGGPVVHEIAPATTSAEDTDAAIADFARAYLEEESAAEDAAADVVDDEAEAVVAPQDDIPGESPESAERRRAAAPKGPNVAQKIQIALHGDKDERGAILRDLNKTLHPYVLRNPNLQVDEVLNMAKMTTISVEVLKAIADRREWIARADIALALVRNPKTPVPLAIKLLANVSPADVRQLAKDTKTRGPVQSAARKRVLGST